MQEDGWRRGRESGLQMASGKLRPDGEAAGKAGLWGSTRGV